MHKIQFDLGEERHVPLLIHSVNQEPFTIRSAVWELINIGEVEASGTCEIRDHVIDTRIAPKKKGSYRIVITYCVADETLIEKIEVVVT